MKIQRGPGREEVSGISFKAETPLEVAAVGATHWRIRILSPSLPLWDQSHLNLVSCSSNYKSNQAMQNSHLWVEAERYHSVATHRTSKKVLGILKLSISMNGRKNLKAPHNPPNQCPQMSWILKGPHSVIGALKDCVDLQVTPLDAYAPGPLGNPAKTASFSKH